MTALGIVCVPRSVLSMLFSRKLELGNHHRLYLMIEALVPSCLRRKDPFSIVLLDIGNTKQFNDVFA